MFYFLGVCFGFHTIRFPREGKADNAYIVYGSVHESFHTIRFPREGKDFFYFVSYVLQF